MACFASGDLAFPMTFRQAGLALRNSATAHRDGAGLCLLPSQFFSGGHFARQLALNTVLLGWPTCRLNWGHICRLFRRRTYVVDSGIWATALRSGTLFRITFDATKIFPGVLCLAIASAVFTQPLFGWAFGLYECLHPYGSSHDALNLILVVPSVGVLLPADGLVYKNSASWNLRIKKGLGYVSNVGPMLDLKILIASVHKGLRADGVTGDQASSDVDEFATYDDGGRCDSANSKHGDGLGRIISNRRELAMYSC